MATAVTNNTLPTPDADALLHSQQVMQLLQEQAAVGELPSFGHYMNLALYEPGLGYYMSGNTKFGRGGDFTTAPETSSLFGRCIAQQLVDGFQFVTNDVLEFGAGTGQLAVDILLELTAHDALPQRYLILEPSAELAARQRSRLAASLTPAVFQRVVWLERLPEDFCGVMLANEVLDAMPVECIEIGQTRDQLLQRFVAVEGDRLVDRWLPAESDVRAAAELRLGNYLDELPAGYRTELSLQLPAWFQAIGECMAQGLLLIIDYGYPRSEYYLEERAAGTLRCYYRHHLHDDPLVYPGLQDITADVDFSLVVESASAAGLDLHGYTTQAQFLIDNGITRLAERVYEDLAPERDQERFLIAQQVKTLTMASAMGERFQVMGLSRGIEEPLRGFESLDLSHRL